ncbi:MAG: DnaJ domain-containing protein [Acidimicrobiales bacterium]|nr:DnaJ domain-containing protein [Acidimicrobiales bacterium]MYH75981.1 DnaJ domain-containing protein [Acidimicrobiales bacterium]MYJ46369.1 DnaJ domain-containing protein [Acidimicrobiales bacterium]MYK72587.1 DnaJ domain-containing protein [Acidimicrobiales bacterium]
MAQLPDHYATLGVRPDADTAAIRRAWIRAARANHPDQRGDVTEAQSERSDSRMRSVNEAWRVLGSADSRRSYDEERAAAAPRPSEPSPPASPAERAAAGGASHDEPSDPWFDGGATTVEPGGPGGFVVRHRSAALVVRVLPWLAIAVVGLVIFVASAYMTASDNVDQSRVAALEVGECFWFDPDGTLFTVACDWPQTDGVLDEIITTSASDRCRHPDAAAHPAPIAGRRLCLVPVDRWEPPAAE